MMQEYAATSRASRDDVARGGHTRRKRVHERAHALARLDVRAKARGVVRRNRAKEQAQALERALDVHAALVRRVGRVARELGEDADQVGYLGEAGRAIFGRSYVGEPDRLIEQLRGDTAVAEADTLLITVPNQLGVDYNAHVIESILKHVAPALGWR